MRHQPLHAPDRLPIAAIVFWRARLLHAIPRSGARDRSPGEHFPTVLFCEALGDAATSVIKGSGLLKHLAEQGPGQLYVAVGRCDTQAAFEVALQVCTRRLEACSRAIRERTQELYELRVQAVLFKVPQHKCRRAWPASSIRHHERARGARGAIHDDLCGTERRSEHRQGPLPLSSHRCGFQHGSKAGVHVIGQGAVAGADTITLKDPRQDIAHEHLKHPGKWQRRPRYSSAVSVCRHSLKTAMGEGGHQARVDIWLAALKKIGNGGLDGHNGTLLAPHPLHDCPESAICRWHPDAPLKGNEVRAEPKATRLADEGPEIGLGGTAHVHTAAGNSAVCKLEHERLHAGHQRRLHGHNLVFCQFSIAFAVRVACAAAPSVVSLPGRRQRCIVLAMALDQERWR